jgi:tetratricopeptide (TPR) repeat protein
VSAVRQAAGSLLLLGVSLAGSLALGEAAVRALDAWRKREAPTQLEQLAALAREAGVEPGALNAYYLGESTMQGVPYDPRMSIPKLVEDFFGGAVGGRPIRSVNLARSGENLRFNSDRLDAVLAHPEIFHPHLVVIYLGHNEFLRFLEPSLFEPESASAWRRALAGSVLQSRVAQRLAKVRPLDVDRRALLDVPCARSATRERVLRLYEEGLANAVDAALARGVAVVLSTTASNVSDFEPSRSTYCGPAARRAEFEGLAQETLAAERAGRDDDALASARRALELCGDFAELHFRLGRIHERRGERERARAAYQTALDRDAMPMRATRGMNEAVLRIGRERGVPVADPVARLAAQSERPAPGYDWFVDAHHPNEAGFVVIAREIAEAIRERFAAEAPLAALDRAAAIERFGLGDPAFRFDKVIHRGRWFARVATLRFDPEDRLARAEAAFAEGASLAPERSEPVLGHAMVAFLRRDAARGDAALSEARRRDPAGVDVYLATPWVRAVVERGRGAAVARDRTYSPASIGSPE